MPKGGARPGAGRKPTGNVRCVLTVKAKTLAKIERMRKSTPLWKRRGEVVDHLVKEAKFKGEKAIYALAEEILK